MKYVIVRCEDHVPSSRNPAPLLEGAKAAHLQQLAQAGAGGLIRPRVQAGAPGRFELHRGFFGLGPHDPEPSAGRCCAASVNRRLDPGETAWCFDFITQRDGVVIDPTAGRITTRESEMLIQALEDQLGSETRDWDIGQGPHHLVVVRDAVLAGGRAALAEPEQLVGRRWKRQLPRGPLGLALRSLIEQAAGLLDVHPVNRVRVDLGENPANMPWLWGAGESTAQRLFADRTGLSGAVVSTGFLVRGLAAALGLRWIEGPASLAEEPLTRATQAALEALGRCDALYLHLAIDAPEPVQRLCAMERIDQSVLKPLTEALPDIGPWRLLVAVDNRADGSVALVAIGTDLPRHPVAHVTGARLAESSLVFRDSAAVFAWLTQPSGASSKRHRLA